MRIPFLDYDQYFPWSLFYWATECEITWPLTFIQANCLVVFKCLELDTAGFEFQLSLRGIFRLLPSHRLLWATRKLRTTFLRCWPCPLLLCGVPPAGAAWTPEFIKSQTENTNTCHIIGFPPSPLLPLPKPNGNCVQRE